MLDLLALITVLSAGLYLIALALVSFLKPDWASGFLLGFASSASIHYLELAIRIAIGSAFVISAPRMMFPEIFHLFGWILIGTSACLLLIPWQWHQMFARQAVPKALRHIKPVAAISLLLGVVIIAFTMLGSVA